MSLKWTKLLALAAALTAVVAAGCGGGAATPTPAATSTAAPSPTATQRASAPTPVPAAAATATQAPAATTAPTATPAAGVAPTPITAATGRRGGTLTLWVPAPYNQGAVVDTYDTRGGSAWFWTSHIMSNLVIHDPYNEKVLVGDLAESWTLSADGTQYTFKLRPAQWHDGKPVTAADIVYNLNRAKNPAATSTLKAYVRGIASVEAVDASTVKMSLDQPSASVLDRLSIRQFLMYPSHMPFPDKQSEFQTRMVGSGPFVFKSWTRDDKIEATRNPNYFKKDLPYLDGVTLYFGSTEAGVAGTRAGKYDLVLYQATQLKDTTDILVRDQKWTPIDGTAGRSDFHLNGQRALWQKAQVRQALMMGLDRRFILDGWLRGEGGLIASPSLPPELGGRWGLPANVLNQRPGFSGTADQNLAKAKQLLKDAGVDPGGITLQYMAQTAGIAPYEPVMASALEKLGFKVQIILLATGDATTQKQQGNFDITHEIASINVDDPMDNGGMQGVLTTSATNYGKWSDAEFERLAAEQDRTIDEAKRRQLAYQLQEKYLDLAFVIPVLYRNYTTAYPPYVKNFPKPAFSFSPVYKHEQIWLEK